MRSIQYLFVIDTHNELYKTFRFTFTTDYSHSARNDEQSKLVSLRAVESESLEGMFCLSIDAFSDIWKSLKELPNLHFGDNYWIDNEFETENGKVLLKLSKYDEFMLFDDGEGRNRKCICGSVGQLMEMFSIAKDCGLKFK